MNSAHFELDCDKSADWWREADLEMLRRCDAILLIPGWERSKGAKMEHVFAIKHGILDFYDIDNLKGWLDEAAESSSSVRP